jgi:hypothetical protein
MKTMKIAKGLGWFSVALGAAQLGFPEKFSRYFGTGQRMVRAMGAREIASGLGVLTQRYPAEAMWSRTAGDLVDIAVLSRALTRGKVSKKARLGGILAAVIGIGVLDGFIARKLQGYRRELQFA